MKNLLATWKRRILSIKGKVTIIKSLAVLPLIYLANVIYVPPQVITEINEIIVEFFFSGMVNLLE